MKMSARSRVGMKPRVEYVNRAGDPVDPKTGRPLAITTRKNKEIVRYPHIPYPSIHPLSKSIKRDKDKKGKKMLPIKRTGALFGNLDEIPTEPRIDPPPHVCFNCWLGGHNRSQCPRPVVDRYCKNCGRRGEDISTCPRCARQHQIYLQETQGMPADLPNNYQFVNNEPDADEVLQLLIFRDQERRQKDLEREVQERHIGMTAFEESSNIPRGDSPQRYKNPSRHPRDTSPYQYDYAYNSQRDNISPYHSCRGESPSRFAPEWSRDDDDRSPYRSREGDEYQRYRRDSPYRESSPMRSNGHKSPVDDYSKHTNLDDNPVQEMLALIKSISHLSSNTQELIVKQVMEERQYKLKLKLEQNNPNAIWP